MLLKRCLVGCCARLNKIYSTFIIVVLFFLPQRNPSLQLFKQFNTLRPHLVCYFTMFEIAYKHLVEQGVCSNLGHEQK